MGNVGGLEEQNGGPAGRVALFAHFKAGDVAIEVDAPGDAGESNESHDGRNDGRLRVHRASD